MTIEFHCPHCDKLLKTPDDKAGVRANCPGCGEIVTIPDPANSDPANSDSASEVAETDPSFTEVVSPSDASGSELTTAQAADGEAAKPGPVEARAGTARSQYDMKPCPMCGAAIDKTAVRCHFCGETLSGPAASVRPRTTIDAGEVLARAWEIYRTRLGSLIGSVVVMWGILFAVAFAAIVAQPVVLAAIGLAGGNGARAADVVLIFFGFVALNFVMGVVFIVVFALLQAGFHVYLLGVARGKDPDISSLFSGSRFFWRFFWGNVLFAPAVSIGSFMCLVPGVLLLLVFWPVYYVMVDRDAGMIDSLRLASEATSGNYLQVLVLFVAGIGCLLLGNIPGICLWFLFKSQGLAIIGSCAGSLFSVPLWMLLWPVAYCGISGQLAAHSA